MIILEKGKVSLIIIIMAFAFIPRASIAHSNEQNRIWFELAAVLNPVINKEG